MTASSSFPAGPSMTLPKNGFGVTALVLGIVGACFALIPVIGVIAWPMVIIGLIFGVLGILRARSGKASNLGVAIAGTALSGVGLALCIGWLAVVGAAAGNATSPGGAAPGAPVAPPAVQQPAAGEKVTTLEIVGEGEATVSVTSEGTSMNTLQLPHTVTLPEGFATVSVTRSPSFESYTDNGGPDSSSVGCRLVRDGKVVDEQHSEGEFASVTCTKMF